LDKVATVGSDKRVTGGTESPDGNWTTTDNETLDANMTMTTALTTIDNGQ